MQADEEAGRHYCQMQQCLPPLPLSSPQAPYFHFSRFWLTELFRFVQMSCFHFSLLEVEIESDLAWPPSITQAKLQWMCSLDHSEHAAALLTCSYAASAPVLRATLPPFIKPHLNILHRTKAIMLGARRRVRGRRPTGRLVKVSFWRTILGA